MNFSEVVQAIATIGFPAACCAFLLYQNAKQQQAMLEELGHLRETLQENTEVTKQLVEYLKN